MHARGPDALDCLARARPKLYVLGDQRPVEVARNRVDVVRKIGRKVQPEGFVRKSTSAVMSDAGSFPYVFGMTFFG
jgi:hypothetical protein